MTGLARWCFQHRWTVLAGWLVVIAALAGISSSIGSSYSNSFSLPGTESSKAMDLLVAQSHGRSGDVDSVVLHAKTGTLTAPAVEAKIGAVLAEMAKVPQVASVLSPFSAEGAAQLSSGGQIAYATVTFTKDSHDLATGNIQHVIDLGSSLRSADLQVEFQGQAIDGLSPPSTSSSELIGVLAAAVVLLLAFGSLLAMAIPLIAAIFALGSAILTIGLLSHILTISTIAPTIAALVGLGVGIDYALFIVTRHRTGIKAGLTPVDAAVAALNTSGRAVLFAGATVAVAMLGLLILGVGFLSGIGISAAVMLAFAVAIAVTMLPALFGVFGNRVLSRRQRAALARDGASDVHTSGPWFRWAGFVQRHPIPLTVVASTLMLALVVPFFSLRLGASDNGNNPTTSTTRQAYDLLAKGFGPGYNGPLQLVARTPSPAAAADLVRLENAIAAQPGVASVRAGLAEAGATVHTVEVTPTTSPQSADTAALIAHLRKDVIPAYSHDDLAVYVGGNTATFQDFASVLAGKIPLFIAIIVLLGSVLLMLAFRSLLIPLTAAVMNLLSAGAAFGVVVAVFQWGWGSSTLNGGAAGPIEAFLPAMMLAILFGLSMDYEVFLVSRMHEEWVKTGDNRRAVRVGQAATGRVITAAAVIMICVFMAFVLGGQRIIAEFGLGLSSAILLDALVVRTVLVPAAMQLFGRANWYLPKSIDRVLPHVTVETADVAQVPSPRPYADSIVKRSS